ncbi:amidohydrolase family protein [Solimonas sp. SE-A11]|uniref:amidohydrolase family protein n=1 Tax=Solimonas sp. SE-A11 TaxID=3054954 RepID=UPI00259CE32C|nr:amidohydrolase family protein [Solimonas sp. SE-A11]MDM4769692.1 amidohydrolase family protein [Solimonas sp. SE-A11]
MLIRRAELGGLRVDLRLRENRIVEIAEGLPVLPGEDVLDAAGGALLPGLKDHHLHLHALAAARASVDCGPPADADALAQALRYADRKLPPGQWLRGIGYHESVAGDIDRHWLDATVPERPLRLQHRSGRLWLLNSAALALVEQSADDPLERRGGRATGRLYDADAWLRTRIGGRRPALGEVSRWLASRGVTGLCDTSHDNDTAAWSVFAGAQQRGELLQSLRVMGSAALDAVSSTPGLQRGERKFHLHDHELPDFDELCADIRAAHAANRGVAFHCVSRVDLAFALAALQEAGVRGGDRIEHASVCPPEFLEQVGELGLIVVTQPGFIAIRGDAYLRDVEDFDRPWLYRLRGFLDRGIRLAGSSDAPYGDADPWAAMDAAVRRRTASGQSVAGMESLTPEQALALFTSPLEAPGCEVPKLEVGAVADLCLLTEPWGAARNALAEIEVLAAWREGRLISG